MPYQNSFSEYVFEVFDQKLLQVCELENMICLKLKSSPVKHVFY